MNLEVLELLYPTIDWDKCCNDYYHCDDCGIKKEKERRGFRHFTCPAAPHRTNECRFLDLLEDILQHIQEGDDGSTP
jgi:hypothetical protein